mgnify:FL=1
MCENLISNYWKSFWIIIRSVILSSDATNLWNTISLWIIIRLKTISYFFTLLLQHQFVERWSKYQIPIIEYCLTLLTQAYSTSNSSCLDATLELAGSVGNMDISLDSKPCTHRMTLVLVHVIHADIPLCSGFMLDSIVSFFRMVSRYVSSSRAVQMLA